LQTGNGYALNFIFVKKYSAMEVKGKIYKVNPVQTGEGKNGVWKKQEVVIETDGGKYPKKVCVVFWTDLVNDNAFQEGNDISVEADVESREYNGKWYTDVKAWRVNKSEQRPAQSPSAAVDNPATDYNEVSVPNEQIEDDLPF
jgi:hypothetical protein